MKFIDFLSQNCPNFHGGKMSDNIRLRGKYYYYDMMIDGVRYKGTTKTVDKKLAEHIADTIKTDILRKKTQPAVRYES